MIDCQLYWQDGKVLLFGPLTNIIINKRILYLLTRFVSNGGDTAMKQRVLVSCNHSLHTRFILSKPTVLSRKL